MPARGNLMAWKNDNVEPNAFLFAIQLIENSLNLRGSSKFIYDYTLFRNLEPLGMPAAADVVHAFRTLKKQKIVELTLINSSMASIGTGVRRIVDKTQDDELLVVRVADAVAFHILYRQVHGALLEDLSPPPLCTYDDKSRVGYINNSHKFVLNKQYGRLFSLLYQNAGSYVTRIRVEDAIKGVESIKVSTNDINEMVKYLRGKTGLSPKHLQQDKGSLRLDVRKQPSPIPPQNFEN